MKIKFHIKTNSTAALTELRTNVYLNEKKLDLQGRCKGL